jgi:hypothetical protein
MTTAITLGEIDRITGGRLGTYDVACPDCGPDRRTAVNRMRKVLRIWRLEPGFATFHCARCGEKGHARDRLARPPDPVRLAAARRDAEERERAAAIRRLGKARWLWSLRRPAGATVVEAYLKARGCGPIPGTIGFLPARGEHGPAMIAAFGLPDEPEPGVISIAADSVTGIHITRLALDGSNKAGTERDKIMIGSSTGSPIVLAPVSDLLGLAVTEGIEDGLSAFEATGLGAWAAGSASRLPALADAIPAYAECVTLLVDDDHDGRHHATTLASLIAARGIEVRAPLFSNGGIAA